MTLTVKAIYSLQQRLKRSNIQRIRWDLNPAVEEAFPGVYPPTSYLQTDEEGTVYLPGYSYLEIKFSVTSPGWFVPVTGYDTYRARSKRAEYLRRPVEPVYSPPKFKMLKEPKLKELKLLTFQEPKVSLRPMSEVKRKIFLKKREVSYQRFLLNKSRMEDKLRLSFEKRMDTFRRLLEKRLEIVMKYDAAHLRRMETYRIRFLQWQERSSVKLLPVRVKRARVQSGTVLPKPENPFNHLILRALSDGLFFQSGFITYHGDGWNQSTWSQAWKYDFYSFYQDGTAGDDFTTAALVGLSAMFYGRVKTLDARTLHKLRGKIQAKKVHLGNIIAERSRSAELISTSLKRLFRTLLDFSRKRFIQQIGKYLGSPKALANDYLAFKFGVQPLLLDIWAAGEAIEKSFLSSSDYISYKSVTTVPLLGEILFSPQGSYLVTGQLKVSWVVKYNLNSVAHSLNSFGLSNPLEIVWEVIPWSFVIDWVIPIGKWITSLMAESGLEQQVAIRTVVFNGIVQSLEQSPTIPTQENLDGLVSVFQPSPEGITVDSSRVSGKFAMHWKDRQIFPSVELPLANFSNPLSWTHSFESLALLIQRIAKLKS